MIKRYKTQHLLALTEPLLTFSWSLLGSLMASTDLGYLYTLTPSMCILVAFSGPLIACTNISSIIPASAAHSLPIWALYWHSYGFYKALLWHLYWHLLLCYNLTVSTDITRAYQGLSKPSFASIIIPRPLMTLFWPLQTRPRLLQALSRPIYKTTHNFYKHSRGL